MKSRPREPAASAPGALPVAGPAAWARAGSRGGHTLTELLISLGVISLLVALVSPFFGDHLTGTREALMVRNIEALALLEEDHRLARGRYVAGIHDPLDPDNPQGLGRRLGWQPPPGQDIGYVVALEADGYSVTATDGAGSSITRKYP